MLSFTHSHFRYTINDFGFYFISSCFNYCYVSFRGRIPLCAKALERNFCRSSLNMFEKIDRAQLREALHSLKSIVKDDTQKAFSWSGKPEDSILADAKLLYVEGVGLVNLPLELEDVLKLAERFPCNETQASTSRNTGLLHKSCCVDASHITIIPRAGGPTTQEILQKVTYQTVESMLDISFDNLEFNIEAKLKKLVICQQGESCKCALNNLDETGKFGTLFIQVPISGEKPSGSIDIHNGAIGTHITLGSDKCYTVAAVAEGYSADRVQGNFVIQSDNGEVTAVLMFSLLWNDHSTFKNIIPPYRLPELLVSTNQLKSLFIRSFNFDKLNAQHDSEETDEGAGALFLCLPPSGPNKVKLNLSDLAVEDDIAARSLSKISYLEVLCGSIKSCVDENAEKSKKTSSLFPKAYSQLGPYFQFTDHYSSTNIAYDIRKFDYCVCFYFIEDLKLQKFAEDEKLPISVIVVRPRYPRCLSIGKTYREQWIFENVLDSLEERLTRYAVTDITGNSFICRSLLKDFERLLELLRKDSAKATCKRCLFSRLFDVCVQLKAETLALNLLQEAQKLCENPQELFISCANSCQSKVLDPTFSFSSFIRFTNGWETRPDILKEFFNQPLSVETFAILCDIGVNLLHMDYYFGAQETFNVIFKAVGKLKPEEFKKMFHTRLITLAISLHRDDEQNTRTMHTLLDLMRHLEPSQLVGLIEQMGKSNSSSLSYMLFMKKLGYLIAETCLVNLDHDQYFKILTVLCSLKEEELVKTFWTSICAQCVRIHNSEFDVECLFCESLRRSACKGVLSGLVGVAESKEAVLCSMQRLKHNRENVNVAQFLDCTLHLGDIGVLSSDEVFENWIAILTCMPPDDLCLLSCSLFPQMCHQINKNGEVRRIYEWLLEQVAHFDVNVLSNVDNEDILQGFAWFGSLDLVKLVVVKFKTGEADERMRLSMILDALEVDVNGFCAASSVTFNREVFNFLMLECLKMLEGLDNRSYECAVCFNLIATSERSFIDPVQAPIVSAWTALSGRLTFLETAELVKKIFHREINVNKQELKLQKFPCCWRLFIALCNSVISKWDVNVVRDQVSVNLLAVLVQSFMWTSEKKAIGDLCRLVSEISRSVEKFAKINSVIARLKLTQQMATSSQHALLAFNDLIDQGIQILSQNKSCQAAGSSNGGLPKETQLEIAELLALRKKILTEFLGQVKSASAV